MLALRWLTPPATAFMLLDPVPLEAIDYQWTAWDAIDPSVLVAFIASEDQKFPAHFGFDLASIRDAIEDRRDGGTLRGASTITQQVAKNLFLWPGRSFVRKAIEAYFTVLIELTWSKRRILEVYVNVAELGPGVYGVGAASRRYFGKRPDAIDPGEAALLAAVLPSPKRLHVDDPSDYLRDRQRWIVGQMRRLSRAGVLDAVQAAPSRLRHRRQAATDPRAGRAHSLDAPGASTGADPALAVTWGAVAPAIGGPAPAKKLPARLLQVAG